MSAITTGDYPFILYKNGICIGCATSKCSAIRKFAALYYKNNCTNEDILYLRFGSPNGKVVLWYENGNESVLYDKEAFQSNEGLINKDGFPGYARIKMYNDLANELEKKANGEKEKA